MNAILTGLGIGLGYFIIQIILIVIRSGVETKQHNDRINMADVMAKRAQDKADLKE